MSSSTETAKHSSMKLTSSISCFHPLLSGLTNIVPTSGMHTINTTTFGILCKIFTIPLPASPIMHSYYKYYAKSAILFVIIVRFWANSFFSRCKCCFSFFLLGTVYSSTKTSLLNLYPRIRVFIFSTFLKLIFWHNATIKSLTLHHKTSLQSAYICYRKLLPNVSNTCISSIITLPIE